MAGWGVWTLVAAPLVLFWSRAIGMTIAARSLVWPSFRFEGAGEMFRFGGAMVVVQFFWFIQSQSDVFIAGRVLDPHTLGLYTTALFLTQILSAKFVPPLNEVAFAAYSRIQDRRDAVGSAFLKAVRLIMLIALPFYLGLAVTAEPLVLTVLGPKWADAVPLVAILALAMPFMTLQILFAPATNALGKPGIAVRVAITGAIVLPICFLVGIGHGIRGMAIAWLVGFPILTAATATLSLPVIGVGVAALGRAIAPGFAASAGMALLVMGLDTLLPAMPPLARLSMLVGAGASAYGALILLFAPALLRDLASFIRRPKQTLAV
jgi:O-antigen/teichoic acid export membrane protein